MLTREKKVPYNNTEHFLKLTHNTKKTIEEKQEKEEKNDRRENKDHRMTIRAKDTSTVHPRSTQ